MTYSQKYTLVQFLEPIQPGAEFSTTNWPLHITLADVFAVEVEITDILGQLTELLAKIRPFFVTTAQITQLGPTDNSIQVRLLEPSDELHALHESLVNILEKNEAIFNTPEYTRSGFLPHVTVQKGSGLAPGAHVQIKSLSLVDMFPGGNYKQRKVLANSSLKKSK